MSTVRRRMARCVSPTALDHCHRCSVEASFHRKSRQANRREEEAYLLRLRAGTVPPGERSMSNIELALIAKI